MTRTAVVAFLAALLLHAAILLFGGLLLFHDRVEKAKVEEVEILAGPEEEKKKDREKEEAAKADEQAAEAEAEIQQKAEPLPALAATEAPSNAPAGPALDAMSLSELASVLNPDGPGGGFAESFSLASGGRIGASGTAAVQETIGEALTSADLDQKPRPILTVEPSYPAELRRKRLQGTVSVVFLVGTDGRVRNAQVEKSTDPVFDRPALDAVRQWKFEPGTRNGQKVEFKMRQPITFRAS
jgi:protein TonB